MREHSPAIDWMKAAAILAVIVTHSGPYVFGSITWSDRLVRTTFAAFHVTLFLFVSGYLHASATPIGWTVIRRRLSRVLVPYVVATVIVTALGLPPVEPWQNLPVRLLLGSALGVYYFVPVWIVCTLTGLLWSRLPLAGLGLALGVVTVATVLRTQLTPLGSVNFFWTLRDPFLQGYLVCYLGGWIGRVLRLDAIVQRVPWRGVLLAGVLMTPWFINVTRPAPFLRMGYALGVAVVCFALVRRQAPAVVRWLAAESFILYLWHIVLVAPLVAATPNVPALLRIVLVAGTTVLVIAVSLRVWRHVSDAVTHLLRHQVIDRAREPVA